MAFYTGQEPIRAGDHVTEIDGRHVAKVCAIYLANDRPAFAKLRWLDTGWVSHMVPVTDLERAPIGSY